ncbi:hypothetical protein ACFQX6_65860 [Streptosporangium lutulentum]
MSIGHILHTPAVAAYLASEAAIHHLVSAAARELITLIVPSAVLAAATGSLTAAARAPLTFETSGARSVNLLCAPITVLDHLVSGPGDDPDPDRAIRVGHLAYGLNLDLADAHTAAIATLRWWPIFTTRAAATGLLRIEPRLALTYIG